MPSAWSDLDRPPLREAALRTVLTVGQDAWRSIDVVAETGSTNADLLERARAGEPGGAVLVADSQNEGRGRLGRVWTIPPRAGLSVSVLVRPTTPIETWNWLSLATGVAVTDALIRVCGLPATLKWPNDVLVPGNGVNDYAGDRLKVAGILAEVAGGEPAVVIGIGLNVSQNESEIPVPTATSLRLAGSATTDRDTVLRAVLRSLSRRLHEYETNLPGLAAAYRERCSTIGAAVRAELPGGTIRTGIAEGVDDAGRLLLRSDDDSVTALSAGDVVHIRPQETA
jgi:BirA family biotin operon repressor/biotin-[acetyl-CoA-carboxylase] ligase